MKNLRHTITSDSQKAMELEKNGENFTYVNHTDLEYLEKVENKPYIELIKWNIKQLFKQGETKNDIIRRLKEQIEIIKIRYEPNEYYNLQVSKIESLIRLYEPESEPSASPEKEFNIEEINQIGKKVNQKYSINDNYKGYFVKALFELRPDITMKNVDIARLFSLNQKTVSSAKNDISKYNRINDVNLCKNFIEYYNILEIIS